jgi:SAM-dependent methyltransferase
MMAARYDTLGVGYARRRRPDPRIAARIEAALRDARNVINVGAGAGSYEPTDRPVVAFEPSAVMAAQRPPELSPAVLARAERLPCADESADAVMAVLTLHHWDDVEAGIREATRVAQRRVVLVTVDPAVAARMWLFAEYIPEVAARDALEFPAIATLLDWLGPRAASHVVPVPRDCTDGFLLSFWGRPEAVLDAEARRATSGFARLDPATEADAVARLARDLRSGAWDEKHGELRRLDEYDAGLRLVVAEL